MEVSSNAHARHVLESKDAYCVGRCPALHVCHVLESNDAYCVCRDVAYWGLPRYEVVRNWYLQLSLCLNTMSDLVGHFCDFCLMQSITEMSTWHTVIVLCRATRCTPHTPGHTPTSVPLHQHSNHFIRLAFCKAGQGTLQSNDVIVIQSVENDVVQIVF